MFVRNLRSMLALSSLLEAKEIRIGQVLNPFSKRVEKPWTIRIKIDKILPLMDRINNLAKEVC